MQDGATKPEIVTTNLLPHKKSFPNLADDVFVAPGAWIIGDVVIGAGSSIWFNTVVRGDDDYIRIGSQTNVQDNCVLHITGGKFPLEIGDRVTIGHRAIVHACVVEDDCLIGMGAIILDGARIGKGSLIAAGTVIPPNFEVPPESLVMGVPAMIKGRLTEVQKEQIRESAAHYVKLAAEYKKPRDDKKRVRGFLG